MEQNVEEVSHIIREMFYISYTESSGSPGCTSSRNQDYSSVAKDSIHLLMILSNNY